MIGSAQYVLLLFLLLGSDLRMRRNTTFVSSDMMLHGVSHERTCRYALHVWYRSQITTVQGTRLILGDLGPRLQVLAYGYSNRGATICRPISDCPMAYPVALLLMPRSACS